MEAGAETALAEPTVVPEPTGPLRDMRPSSPEEALIAAEGQVTKLLEEVKWLKEENAELVNREHAMRQEIRSFLNKAIGQPERNVDHVRIGKILRIEPTDRVGDEYVLTTKVIQQSIAVFGAQGSGKSNMEQVLATRLMRLGVGVIIFDVAGEHAPFFDTDERFYEADIQINPFDNLDGYWSDDDLHGFISSGFFNYLDATNRSATNQGKLTKVLDNYLSDTRKHPEVRNLAHFYQYLKDHADALDIHQATANNLKGYLENFLFNPALRRTFAAPHTSPRVRELIKNPVNAWVMLSGFTNQARSIITVSLLRQIASKMAREYAQLGTNQPRPLTRHIILEETRDIVQGDDEKAWLEGQLRDSRKRGYSFSLIPRDASNLRKMGIDNILAEVGAQIYFQSGGKMPTTSAAVSKVFDAHVAKLQTGEGLFYVAGKISKVKVDWMMDIAGGPGRARHG